jgi:hypothetical protein
MVQEGPKHVGVEQIVALYVLINSSFVGKIILYLSKCTVKQQLKLTHGLYVLRVHALKNVTFLFNEKQMHVFKYIQSDAVISHQHVSATPVNVIMMSYNTDTNYTTH